jgi:hypothetical protein
MTSRQRILACGLLAIAASGACGGDDGDSGNTGVSTGLPSATKLSSLSDANTVQVCSKVAMAFNNLLPTSELKRITCVGNAVTSIAEDSKGQVDSSDIPMCKQLSDDCLSSDDIKEEDLVLDVADETECKTANTNDTFGNCAATVADYESCVGRIMSELRTRLRSLTCDVLNDIGKLDETLNGDIDVSAAPECQALKSKCPKVNLTVSAADAASN